MMARSEYRSIGIKNPQLSVIDRQSMDKDRWIDWRMTIVDIGFWFVPA
jgi:hypothetical protein